MVKCYKTKNLDSYYLEMRKEIHKKKVGELLHKIAEIEINLDIKKIENKKLEEENKKLKEKLERYKKQYEHTMGED